MILQQAHQYRTYQAPTPASLATPSYRQSANSVSVSFTVPAVTAPASPSVEHVSIQGPNGEDHSFQLARGAEVVSRRQHIVLRPGESTTIRLTAVPRR
jgi:hypothetical protein